MKDKFEELQKAKENVMDLLQNADALIGMHDIVYWADVVQRLRKEIKEML